MTKNNNKLQYGDFSALAADYAMNRPAYSPFVLNAILSLFHRDKCEDISCVDVGAGTGTWTRMLACKGCKTTAVEPNDEMRKHGSAFNCQHSIKWLKGSAEDTGLKSNTYDLVTMASSFHWTDYDRTVSEFSRILKQNGLFAALWNTRVIDDNPLLVKIENKFKELVPDLKRVSSGRSNFCDNLTNRLMTCGKFKDVLYLESHHTELQTQERFIGLWRSVNALQVQAGEKKFGLFIRFIEEQTSNIEFIEAKYLTRSWVAVK